MRNTLLMMLILALCGSMAYSENSITVNSSDLFDYPSTLSTKNSKNQAIILTTNNNMRPIILKSEQVTKLFQSGNETIRLIDFPVNPIENKNVVLRKVSSVVNSETKFYLNTKNGKKEMPAVNIQSYRGFIEGVDNSRIFVNYTNDMLFTIIENGKGESYNMAPVNYTDMKSGAHILSAIIDKENPTAETGFKCLTEDYHGPKTEATDDNKHADGILALPKLLETGIVCEGTSEYYKMTGSNFALGAAYMVAVIAVSSQIYENDINIKINVNKIEIWDDALVDPYINDPLLSDKLQTMPSVWFGSSTKRSLVVLFADLNAQHGTLVAGISMGGEPNVGSICSNTRGFCVIGIKKDGKYPTLNYTWDVNCATHEMGHNFSSPHTHNCYFQPNMIDTCITINNPIESDACLSGNPIPRPGTIMSYCHLTNNGQVELFFHPRNIKLMRTAAEKAMCIKEPANPTLKLLAPLGQTIYDAKQTIEIRWVYSAVSLFGIKYTSNNGQTWEVVKENVPVTDSIYNWTMPAIGTKQGKIWIYDMSNNVVGDTSWNTFTINAPYLYVKNPVEGGKYSQRTPISIDWDLMLVSSVNIDFSTDGGQTWNSIIKNQATSPYSWDISKITSNNCKVRIVSSSNSSMISETGIFAIGKETATMIYPQGGEVWCGGFSYYINWSADFLDNIMIEYTIDDGLTWKKVRLASIDASLGYFLWKIPSVTSKVTNARMRIYPSNDKESILSITKDFTIDTCLKSDINDYSPIYKNSIQILDVVPNPVSRNAKIKIFNNVSTNEQLVISIYDEKGSLVGNIGKFNLSEKGEQIFEVNIPEVANGHYFLNISAGNYKDSKNIQINK